ncbi:MAG: hypothetical protein GY859_44005, partial [Desulfobacterales bacterium]|nr:hypothetical protein [Desulfobacterales bacterium]
MKKRNAGARVVGFLWVLSIFFSGAGGGAWGATVSDVMVTDVTAKSFSVIWAVDEPAAPGLRVFDDPDGVYVSGEAVAVSTPVLAGDAGIQGAARENGVMKVRVTGLSPGGRYFFQTVTETTAGHVIHEPPAGPFPPVIIESGARRRHGAAGAETPFANDLIVLASFLPDGETPARGTLVAAEVEGCGYP